MRVVWTVDSMEEDGRFRAFSDVVEKTAQTDGSRKGAPFTITNRNMGLLLSPGEAHLARATSVIFSQMKITLMCLS